VAVNYIGDLKGDIMIRLRWSFIYFVVIIFTNFSIASSDVDVDKKVTSLFKINWESMRYNKTVTQYKPKVSSNKQTSSANESLTLSCEIEIKDPNLVLGISRKGLLTGLTDGNKRSIEISQEQSELSRPPMAGMQRAPSRWSMEMAYEGLSYHRQYTQPPTIPRWRALLRKFLRIPQKPFTPVLVNQLDPPRVQFELDLGLLERSGGKIRSLKGYYYALIAESVEYVEVPFEPNEKWVKLTEDTTIQVRVARNTISGSRTRYNYEIEEDRPGRGGIPYLAVGEYLPEKMVMGRQLIKQDGEPLDSSMGHGFLPVNVGGSGSGSHSGSGGASYIKKIRFVIAVKPKHCKIPFELKNIPLPNPDSKEEKE
jgi:hypothetical protein